MTSQSKRHAGTILVGLVIVGILGLLVYAAVQDKSHPPPLDQERIADYEKQKALEQQAAQEKAEQLKKEFGGMELKRLMQTRENLIEVRRLMKAEHITQDVAELRIQRESDREFDRRHSQVDVGPLYEEVQRRVKQQGISEQEAVNQILKEKGEIP